MSLSYTATLKYNQRLAKIGSHGSSLYLMFYAKEVDLGT